MAEGKRDKPEDEKLRGLKTFIAGAMGGAVSRTATAPLDRMRMLLQVSDNRKLTIREVTRTMANEGLLAFFRGNLANVLKIAPENAAKLMLYSEFKQRVLGNKPSSDIHFSERLIAGAICGGIAQTSVYPLETARTRLAVSTAGTYSGVGSCLLSIYRNEGAHRLYAGVGPSVAGILPFAGVVRLLLPPIGLF